MSVFKRVFSKTRSKTPTPNSQKTTSLIQDNAPSNITSALQAAKDLGEIAENIPYIKAIAGVSLTLLKMWEDVRDIDAKAFELLGRVADRTVVLAEVMDATLKDGSARLESLQKDLKSYEELLQKIEAKIVTFRNLKAHQRTLKRAEIKESLEEFIRQLNHSDQLFTFKRLCDILSAVSEIRQTNVTSPANADTMYQDPLPPPPTHFLGRELETSQIINLCLSAPNPRIGIIGTGGMGKTSLAQAVLNDPSITAKFTRVLFVSCEQLTTVIPVLNALANVLEVSAADRGQALQKTVLARLRSTPILLCLDNFEDPWDPPESRRSIEEFLSLLNGIRSLGLIVTMRGTEKPRGLSWTQPAPEPLQPLAEEAALDLFRAVSQCSDERVAGLVEQVSNVPLAIILLAQQTMDEGLDYVLEQWSKEGLELLNRRDGSDSRVTSVTASIDLSLNSPRISQIPHVHDVLRLLAELPSGLSDLMARAIAALMLPAFDFDRTLRVLRRMALCYLDSMGRNRLLVPIRQHVLATLSLEEPWMDTTRQAFIDFINAQSSASSHDIVVPELANVRHCIASSAEQWDTSHILACIVYQWWEGHVYGTRDVALSLLALSHADTPVIEAMCRVQLAEHLLSSYRAKEAEEHLRPALDLVTDDPFWDGQIHLEMGLVVSQFQKHEESESFFKLAIQFFRTSKNQSLEAITLQKLGSLYYNCGRLQEAEELLQQSLQLAKDLKDNHQQAPVRQCLGDVSKLAGRLEEAAGYYRESIICAETAKSVWNEGVAHCSLGTVYVLFGRMEEAEQELVQARDMAIRIHNRRGEANAKRGLGRLYFGLSGRRDSAEPCLREALAILAQLPGSDSKAATHQDLGHMLHTQNRHFEALVHLVLAIAYDLLRGHPYTWKHVVGICQEVQDLDCGL